MTEQDYLDIQYISDIVRNSCQVPVYFIDANFECLFCSFAPYNPLYANEKEWKAELNSFEAKLNKPVVVQTEFQENYLLLSIEYRKNMIGKFIVGPVLPYQMTENMIQTMCNDRSFIVNKQIVNNYYQEIPIMSPERFIFIAKLLYYVIFGRPLSIMEQNVSMYENNQYPELTDSQYDFVTVRRQEQDFHPPMVSEKELMQCIRDGNREDIKRILNARNHLKLAELSTKSYLRNEKNLGISGIAVATRVAIDSGVNAELARTISDQFILQIEEAKHVNEVRFHITSAFEAFASHVNKQKRIVYSKVIKKTLEYIYMYLYDELKVAEIAEFVGVTASYISTQFKKEVGMTISQYIQLQKIEEAKKLMMMTPYTMTEISNQLHFSDQSYFTKVFKKVTGMKPSQYKETIHHDF
ncbi:AraC family transcriptional regulator [Gracilibacillus sp. S3-1-1]|uniref:AraC family transcriptional regulator n=1 Tax=Gracilibacillus pellucidus TaxID=3095368 RepID=A0ACC6M8G3_9BACI|nr:AraC family transcriptional regulator [Gracilibacillus sp. S3-1-1]MDX8047278.1 AraC family transcriptional regulator [Gracilibacillus sp. S3-1-1]